MDIGIRSLISSNKTNVISLTHPKEIYHINDSQRNQVILIIFQKGCLKNNALSKLFLWMWVINCTSNKFRKIPCLVLSDCEYEHYANFYTLSCHLPFPVLSSLLERALLNPSSFIRRIQKIKPLSKSQKFIFEETLRGNDIQEISVKMKANTHKILAERYEIIKKIGFRTRNELMCLSINDFEI
ncbi:hypothetical protein K3J84_004696 [Salmonella enterica]|nr:hypothetical protein [Salmonella enterica subsp. enterica serovar Oslo]EHW8352251.1 hypothetical protein [Salmonella enterica]EHW8353115.1 hypothetical protein [Salmonella enterica]